MRFKAFLRVLESVDISCSEHLDFFTYPGPVDIQQISHELEKRGFLEPSINFSLGTNSSEISAHYEDFAEKYHYKDFLSTMYEIQPYSTISLTGMIPWVKLVGLFLFGIATRSFASIHLPTKIDARITAALQKIVNNADIEEGEDVINFDELNLPKELETMDKIQNVVPIRYITTRLVFSIDDLDFGINLI